jgi:hypothetical protein
VEGYLEKALSDYVDPSAGINTFEKQWRKWYDSIERYRPLK